MFLPKDIFMGGIKKEDEEGNEEGATSIFQNSPPKINVIITKETFSPSPESSSPVSASIGRQEL